MNDPGQAQWADQSEALSFLGDPANHGRKQQVFRIDTHGAIVFLAGENVYKVKRAVHFPFMDFSTLEKRRRACENEVVVNKANAPEIYLGVVAISREDSHLRFGFGAEIVEWAVHMRRFEEDRTLDRLASRGELDLGIAALVAETVAASHRRAPIARGADATAALRGQIEETMASLEAAPDVFPVAGAKLLRRQMFLAFENALPLLLRREATGKVRRCHGDLHLRNIVMIGPDPTLFDALEFDESLSTCDVLYDLAFLLMDLWTRGLHREANALMNHYLSKLDEAASELEGFAALPLFLSLRAAIRAKVTNLEPSKTAETLTAAQRMFEAARGFFQPAGLYLVAIGGLSGTGKTALARRIAPGIGRAPGAIHLRSDVERKRLYRIPEFEPLPGAAYRPEISAIVYRQLRHLATVALAAGQSVVIDAAHRGPEERHKANVAKSAAAQFTGLWLEAPLDVRLGRASRRKYDASDAGPEIVAAQAQESLGPIAWRRLEASQPIEEVFESARAAIKCGLPPETPK
jgi:aminoglycoside phosphotransferase family enzyme/predicted kinase